jgi:ribonuclease T1
VLGLTKVRQIDPASAFPTVLHRVALGLVVALSMVLGGPAGAKRPTAGDELAVVSLASLPREARETDQLIRSGGPFPHERKDGSVFGNREGLLPKKARGTYREYTVKTPGSRDRGARRIVCAGKEPKTPDVCYYTADHYSSFKRIVP